MSISISSTEISLPDNAKLKLGAGDDLEISHNGSVELIESKSLYLIQEAQNHIFRNLAGDEAYAKFFNSGAVELYHAGSKKFDTKSDGVDITGELQCDSLDVDGAADFTGQITSNDTINLASGKKLSMAGDVFKIYHATNAAIINESGDFIINQTVSNKDIKISTGSSPTERMRIHSNGAVAIGSDLTQNAHALAVGHASGSCMVIANTSATGGGSHDAQIVAATQSHFNSMKLTGHNIKMHVNNSSEGITESWRFLADKSFRSSGCISSQQGNGVSCEQTSNGGRIYIGRGNSDAVMEFQFSGSRKGSISINSSNTSYNTSSDYRLKENVIPISNAITRLKTLKPSRFNFKADKDTTVDGFLAHEVTAVPEAVTGEKDAMRKIYYVEGDEIPKDKKIGDFKEFSTTEIEEQQIDQSKLVPLLVAAVQELAAKVEALEAA